MANATPARPKKRPTVGRSRFARVTIAKLTGLVLAMSAVVLLVILNSGWFARNAGEAPIIYRPPVEPLLQRLRPTPEPEETLVPQ